MAIATGRSEAQLKQQYNEEGDIGIVARKNKGKQATLIKPVPLTIRVRPPQAPRVLYALLVGPRVPEGNHCVSLLCDAWFRIHFVLCLSTR
jgi:hypothetical protein